MPDQGFDLIMHMNAQPAREMPNKIFKPPWPPFPTRGKQHYCKERNMGLPPLFPRPLVIENIRQRGGTGHAALRSLAGALRFSPEVPRGGRTPAGRAAATAASAPTDPEAHTGPCRARTVTRRAEHAAVGPDRDQPSPSAAQTQTHRPTHTYRPGPPAPPPPGRQQEVPPASVTMGAGHAAQRPCSRHGTARAAESPRGTPVYRTRRSRRC